MTAAVPQHHIAVRDDALLRERRRGIFTIVAVRRFDVRARVAHHSRRRLTDAAVNAAILVLAALICTRVVVVIGVVGVAVVI